VTFRVVTLAEATHAYAAADNHDPDGDSDGSTINVTRP
jgi:hypothetical protein